MAAQAPKTGSNLSEGLDLYGRPAWNRVAGNYLGWGLCILAVIIIAAPLISVLWGVIGRAIPVWHWSVLTEPTTATGGGLANEILGTLVIVAGVGYFGLMRTSYGAILRGTGGNSVAIGAKAEVTGARSICRY